MRIPILNHRTGAEITSIEQVDTTTLAYGMTNLRLADLRNLDLRSADFSFVSLSEAQMAGSDYSDAKFNGTEMAGTWNLEGWIAPDAQFYNANLHGIQASGANFKGAKFLGANLSVSQFRGADFSGADLRLANLKNANLDGASLRDASLQEATFGGTRFAGADLYGAKLGKTTIVDCGSIYAAQHLGKVFHEQESYIDLRTLRYCTKFPKQFMKGVGCSDHEIDYLEFLFSKPVEFSSCFISFGGPDMEFSLRLHHDLEQREISAYHFVHDREDGQYLDHDISKNILLQDRLLVICSKDSLYREGVVNEIIKGIEKEEKTGQTTPVLYPIWLDEHVLSDEFREYHDRMVETGRWKRPWLGIVKKISSTEFQEWRNSASYNQAVDRLVRNLRAKVRTD